jgi:hypothetical protein
VATIIGPYPSPTLPPLREEGVVILDVWERVKRNGGDVVHTFLRFAVQRLDVAQRVREAQARHANLVGREPVKHEGIVRVGAMRDVDFACPRVRRPV